MSVLFCVISFLLGMQFEKRRVLIRKHEPDSSVARNDSNERESALYVEIKPKSDACSTFDVSYNVAYGNITKIF